MYSRLIRSTPPLGTFHENVKLVLELMSTSMLTSFPKGNLSSASVENIYRILIYSNVVIIPLGQL